MASGLVPRMGTPARNSGTARFSGVWPPNVDDHAVGPFLFHNVHHVFKSQRLEDRGMSEVS